jgi:hypothetical protein
MTCRQLIRRRILPVLPVLLLGVFCSLGRSQSPAPAQPGTTYNKTMPKTYTNKTYFHLPIQIDERARPSVKQVILFAKEPGSDWQQKMIAAATQPYFTYQASRDGEYWFSVVTVDRNGKASPADVRKEPPALIVVVDQQAPKVELTPVHLPGGEMGLRCKLIDLCPDYTKLQMAYQDQGSQTWTPLVRVPGSPNTFRLPNAPVLNGSVRCTAVDMAGNLATKVVMVRDDLRPAAQDIKQVAAQAPVTTQEVQRPALPAVPEQLPSLTNPGAPSLPKVPVPGNQAKSFLPKAPATGAANDAVPITSLPPAVPSLQPQPVAPRTSSLPRGQSRQLLSTTRASIDYKVDKVGPSGVGKVDVWIKADGEPVWKRLCSDEDRRSPVEINLPGEGVFGVQVVLTNGNGFGGRAPQPNDPPSFWIEVDTTRPFAQLQPVEPVVSSEGIELRWTASDKNLGAEPVSLFYATAKEGPWTPIARHIKNSGHFNWQFPRNAGGQFFVRLEVVDEAGNLTRTESAAPVVLDLTEPRASVVGVTGVSAVATPPVGN